MVKKEIMHMQSIDFDSFFRASLYTSPLINLSQLHFDIMN